MKLRDRRKARKRNDAAWRKTLRRDLNRADYWTAPGFPLNKRRSEGRNPRVETWRERQPFTGRIGFMGSLVCSRPGVNVRIAL